MDTRCSSSPAARRSQRSQGFTLVETMVAAVLLSVGILALLGAERNARLLGQRGALRARAVEAAASALDSVRARCSPGSPVMESALAAVVTVGTDPTERPVHVESRIACGTPP